MPYEWDGGPVRARKLFARKMFYVSFNEGITVAREDDGTWVELADYTQDAVVSAYSAALRGGHTAVVSDEHYAELVASGYGDYLTEI